MRSAIANIVIVGLFLILIIGLFNLEVLQGEKFKELSDKNCVRLSPQMGTRGRFLDTQGNVLVDSYLSYDVMLVPQAPDRANELLKEVSRILEVRVEDLKSTFKSNFLSWSMPVLIAKNISLNRAIALEELKMDLDGVTIQPHPLRRYPYGALGCHFIGYLSEIDHWRLTKLSDYGYKTRDIVGYTGLEEKYDYYLRQDEGGLLTEVDHRGKFVRVLGFRPPTNGRDIQLTVDLKIQKIAEASLTDRKGAVIVMDPYSGEILALASGPDFNPAVFVKKQQSESIDGIFNNPEAPLLNRAINGAYPAASVFKVVVATAALEMNKVNPATQFTCQGSMQVGNKKFNCWETHGAQNLIDAIAHSCDVFFYHTGLLVRAQGIHDYALKFGFGKTTGIDLPYEIAGLVPGPLWKKIYRLQSWFDGDTANFAIGQGDLLVTPLQVTRMMAVFANQGMLVTPYIVKGIGGRDVSASKKKVVKLSLKQRTLDYVREGLRAVVSDPAGTASTLSGLPVSVAGKTGTAQVSRGQSHAWFAGFFPFTKPRFVICVFLENGGSGQAAVSLTKQIIQEMIKEGAMRI